MIESFVFERWNALPIRVGPHLASHAIFGLKIRIGKFLFLPAYRQRDVPKVGEHGNACEIARFYPLLQGGQA